MLCVVLMGFNHSWRGQFSFYDSPLDLRLWVLLAVINQMWHANELQQCVFFFSLCIIQRFSYSRCYWIVKDFSTCFFFPRAYKLVLQTLFSIGMQQMRFQPSRSVSTKQTCFNFWPHFFSSVFQKVLSLEVKHKTSPKLFPKYLRFLDVIFCTFSIAGVSIQCWLLLY